MEKISKYFKKKARLFFKILDIWKNGKKVSKYYNTRELKGCFKKYTETYKIFFKSFFLRADHVWKKWEISQKYNNFLELLFFNWKSFKIFLEVILFHSKRIRHVGKNGIANNIITKKWDENTLKQKGLNVRLFI